jgi:hypothetical protein
MFNHKSVYNSENLNNLLKASCTRYLTHKVALLPNALYFIILLCQMPDDFICFTFFLLANKTNGKGT